jgi:hypothetical protein
MRLMVCTWRRLRTGKISGLMWIIMSCNMKKRTAPTSESSVCHPSKFRRWADQRDRLELKTTLLDAPSPDAFTYVGKWNTDYKGAEYDGATAA